ncbi:hypothetical protein KM043_007321 [Ampulex compressa]|nr:hypothetical protein KM043_007321 [Ampulex compressa]
MHRYGGRSVLLVWLIGKSGWCISGRTATSAVQRPTAAPKSLCSDLAGYAWSSGQRRANGRAWPRAARCVVSRNSARARGTRRALGGSVASVYGRRRSSRAVGGRIEAAKSHRLIEPAPKRSPAPAGRAFPDAVAIHDGSLCDRLIPTFVGAHCAGFRGHKRKSLSSATRGLKPPDEGPCR